MRISVPTGVRGASRAALLLAIPWLAAASAGPAPRPPASFDVAGLSAPVEILTDRWGVPHIFASTLDDAFFAQGFQAARDRLWQMDLWRKRGLGEMAGDFGPAWVESDRWRARSCSAATWRGNGRRMGPTRGGSRRPSSRA
jgi:penicillin amidase